MKTFIITLLLLTIGGCGSGNGNKEVLNPPSANAGEDFKGHLYEEITLDGSKSTGSSDLIYQWSLVASPEGSFVNLDMTNVAISTFTPDKLGEYTFSLIVKDGELLSEEDYINVTIVSIPKVKIAKWQGNREKAISFDWDDTNPTHCDIIAPLFEKYDFKATFGVITDTWLDCYINVASNGHEIASHSKSHKVNFGFEDVTNDDRKSELEESLNFLTEKLSVKPTLFIHPWNSIDLDNVIYDEFYLFSRIHNIYDAEENYQANIVSNHDLESLKNFADNNNGWLKIAGHGVDGKGWQPIDSLDLEDFLVYLTEQNTWVDTHSRVALYQMAREQMTAIIKNGKLLLNDDLIDYERLRSFGIESLPITLVIESNDPVMVEGYLTCSDYPLSGEGLMFDYDIMSQAELVYATCSL